MSGTTMPAVGDTVYCVRLNREGDPVGVGRGAKGGDDMNESKASRKYRKDAYQNKDAKTRHLNKYRDEELEGALNDRVHRDPGNGRPVRTVKCPMKKREATK